MTKNSSKNSAGKNFASKNFASKNFDRKMIEIGYIGAFYGLIQQAHEVFSFYCDARYHSRKTQTAAKLGAALALIGAQDYRAAADLLEKDLADFPDDQLLEMKVFLALSYKQAKIRADRVDALLAEMKSVLSGPTAKAIESLTAG